MFYLFFTVVFLTFISCVSGWGDSEGWQFRWAPGSVVNTQTGRYGRLEMRPENNESLPWGTICSDNMKKDKHIATAACRDLGYEEGIEGLFTFGGMGNDTQPIYISAVSCPSRYLESLRQCGYTYGPSLCDHSDDFGVKCFSTPQWMLDGGTNPWQGRIMMKPNKTSNWGSVMVGNTYTAREGKAVCKGLGYGGSTHVTITGSYGLPNTTLVWLGDLSCPENGNVSDCTYHLRDLNYNTYAVVDCFPTDGIPRNQWEFRLSTGHRAGRMEMRPGPYAAWGSICSIGLTVVDAKAFCNSIGYVSSEEPKIYSEAEQGRGSGPIYLNGLGCPNLQPDHTYIDNCSLTTFGNVAAGCTHDHDAGVACKQGNSGATTDVSQWEFRLVNGGHRTRGRIEMRPGRNSVWGTVCDDSFSAGRAICNMMGFYGYRSSVSERCCAYYGAGYDRIWLDDVRCDSSFSYDYTMASCNWRTLGDHNCGHGEDQGLDCYPYATSARWDVRLRGESVSHRGWVEVRPNSNYDWGSVSGLFQEAAIHVCKWAGYPNAFGAIMYTRRSAGVRFNPQTFYDNVQYRMVYMSNVRCPTTTSTYYLGDCSYDFVPVNQSHYDDVWIDCNPNIVARFVDGPTPWMGRLEVKRSNDNSSIWGTVCNDVFRSQKVAWNAACHSAGFTNVTNASYRSFGAGNGSIVLDEVDCSSVSSSSITLQQCQNAGWGLHNCVHEEDVGLNCYPYWRWQYRLNPPGWSSSATPTAGPLEIQVQSYLPWGGICPSSSFSYSLTSWLVACHSVGIHTNRAEFKFYPLAESADDPIYYIDKINCTPLEPIIPSMTLRQCPHTAVENEEKPVSHCQLDGWPKGVAGVDCNPPPLEPNKWQFRLRPVPLHTNMTAVERAKIKNNPEMGRLEMRRRDSEPWGTICRRGKWSIAMIRAACRSAGYVGAGALLVDLSYSIDKDIENKTELRRLLIQPILLDEVECPGNVTYLSECSHAPFGSHSESCTHAKDIGLDCSYTRTLTATMTYTAVATESKTTSVSFTQTLSLSTSATMTESLNVTRTVSLSNSLSLSETTTASATVSITLSLTASDSLVPTKTVTLSKTRSTSSSLSKTGATPSHVPTETVTETATLTTSLPQTMTSSLDITKSTTISVSETATFSEEISSTLSLGKTTTISLPLPSIIVPECTYHVIVGSGNVSGGSTGKRITDADIRKYGLYFNLTFAPRAVDHMIGNNSWGDKIYFERANGAAREPHGLNASRLEPTCHVIGISLVHCTLPPMSPEYSLYIRESLVLRVDFDALNPHQCSGNAPVDHSFVVYGEYSTYRTVTLAGASASTAAFTMFLGAILGTSPADVLFFAAFVHSDCAGTIDDPYFLLGYALSPFIALGMPAVILGNVGIVVLVLGVHLAVTKHNSRKQRMGMRGAVAATRFPSLSYGVIQLLFPGLCVATFSCLATHKPLYVAVGVFGLVVVFIQYGVLIFLVVKYLRGNFVVYQKLQEKPVVVQMVLPTGFWEPPDYRSAYGALINNFTRRCVKYILFIPAMTFFFSFLLLGIPATCMFRYGAAALVSMVTGILLFGIRPTRLLPNSILLGIGFCLVGLFGAVSGLYYENSTDGLVLAKTLLAVAFFLFLLFRFIYNVVMFLYEWHVLYSYRTHHSWYDVGDLVREDRDMEEEAHNSLLIKGRKPAWGEEMNDVMIEGVEGEGDEEEMAVVDDDVAENADEDGLELVLPENEAGDEELVLEASDNLADTLLDSILGEAVEEPVRPKKKVKGKRSVVPKNRKAAEEEEELQLDDGM